MRGVVVGGGTGAPKSIRALLSMGAETSAVVAMADDGGSTGALRAQLGATAPGDIRKCLVGMAPDPDDPFVRAFQKRFEFGDRHVVGNLVLSALEEEMGDFVSAVRRVEQLLGARGHVHPSTLSDVVLSAETADGDTVTGQARACHCERPLRRVWLECDAPIEANAQATAALREADIVVLGPGSLFTSIIANLVVPGVAESIRESNARVVFVCPIADTQGETAGMSVLDCFDALCRHGIDGRIDAIIVHRPQDAAEDGAEALVAGRGQYELCPGVYSVRASADELRAIEQRGVQVVQKCLVKESLPTWHDETLLSVALRQAL